jgi:exopolyphosphatase/guanosine-5'-triphosphate,3'-diphosphate pyrophosphatase
MGLRTATNAAEFIHAVYRETKCHIRVLSGIEEAEYSCLGTLSTFPEQVGNTLMFDLGGGSSEFIFTTDGTISRSFSIDIGILRVRDEYCKTDPISKADYERMYSILYNTLKQYIVSTPDRQVIGIGGTVCALGSVEQQLPVFDADLVHGTILSFAALERQIELYRSQDNTARKQVPGMPLERSDVILAGATIVNVILELCGVPRFTISTRGVRHGILQEYCNGLL